MPCLSADFLHSGLSLLERMATAAAAACPARVAVLGDTACAKLDAAEAVFLLVQTVSSGANY